jgi:hypothetical protein
MGQLEHAVQQWLRHYATSRKVAGSTPDVVKDFYQFTLSFQPHKTLRFIQSLTEMSARDRNKNAPVEYSANGA